MNKSFTLEEVKRLRNLNLELMETTSYLASYFFNYAKENNIHFPNEEGLVNLIRRVRKLIKEINEEIYLPPFLQHRFRTPSDTTEPVFFLS
jgi:hypothetical protein